MLLTIIIFIIILGLLVFVHEFGHFIVAKKSGMQVDEFGFGFPPRLIGFKKVNKRWKVIGLKHQFVPDPSAHQTEQAAEDSTIYSINWIPLGGFVRILGENNEHEDNPKSFINRGFWSRFATLVAGVLMNVILAWALMSAGFMVGLPAAVSSLSDVPKGASFSRPQVAILEVTKDLPADRAGLKSNDIIIGLDNQHFSDIGDIQKYVKDHAGEPVDFQIQRSGQDLSFKITPAANPPPGQGPTGVALSLIGRLKYPWYAAVWEGGKATWGVLVGIVGGLYQLFAGRLGFASLGGPVEIAKLTGQVAGMGFVYLLQFTAFLSLNLAILNILPFPALDGGRVLFLIIEKIRRKRNNQKIEQIVNTAGFVFLILLMIAVTINDVIRK